LEKGHTSNKNARNRTHRTTGTWSAKKKKQGARSNSKNNQGRGQQREASKKEHGRCAGENGIWTPLTRRGAMDEDARSKRA
jgi:hypothetical protein